MVKVFEVLNSAGECLFKRARGYEMKATKPCAVAYGYARIPRLVRFGGAR